MAEIPGWGQVLQTEVANLQADVADIRSDGEKRWERNTATHKELYQRTERPSWLITWILGGFMSATVGLAVFLFTKG